MLQSRFISSVFLCSVLLLTVHSREIVRTSEALELRSKQSEIINEELSEDGPAQDRDKRTISSLLSGIGDIFGFDVAKRPSFLTIPAIAIPQIPAGPPVLARAGPPPKAPQPAAPPPAPAPAVVVPAFNDNTQKSFTVAFNWNKLRAFGPPPPPAPSGGMPAGGMPGGGGGGAPPGPAPGGPPARGPSPPAAKPPAPAPKAPAAGPKGKAQLYQEETGDPNEKTVIYEEDYVYADKDDKPQRLQQDFPDYADSSDTKRDVSGQVLTQSKQNFKENHNKFWQNAPVKPEDHGYKFISPTPLTLKIFTDYPNSSEGKRPHKLSVRSVDKPHTQNIQAQSSIRQDILHEDLEAQENIQAQHTIQQILLNYFAKKFQNDAKNAKLAVQHPELVKYEPKRNLVDTQIPPGAYLNQELEAKVKEIVGNNNHEAIELLPIIQTELEKSPTKPKVTNQDILNYYARKFSHDAARKEMEIENGRLPKLQLKPMNQKILDRYTQKVKSQRITELAAVQKPNSSEEKVEEQESEEKNKKPDETPERDVNKDAEEFEVPKKKPKKQNDDFDKKEKIVEEVENEDDDEGREEADEEEENNEQENKEPEYNQKLENPEDKKDLLEVVKDRIYSNFGENGGDFNNKEKVEIINDDGVDDPLGEIQAQIQNANSNLKDGEQKVSEELLNHDEKSTEREIAKNLDENPSEKLEEELPRKEEFDYEYFTKPWKMSKIFEKGIESLAADPQDRIEKDDKVEEADSQKEQEINEEDKTESHSDQPDVSNNEENEENTDEEEESVQEYDYAHNDVENEVYPYKFATEEDNIEEDEDDEVQNEDASKNEESADKAEESKRPEEIRNEEKTEELQNQEKDEELENDEDEQEKETETSQKEEDETEEQSKPETEELKEIDDETDDETDEASESNDEETKERDDENEETDESRSKKVESDAGENKNENTNAGEGTIENTGTRQEKEEADYYYYFDPEDNKFHIKRNEDESRKESTSVKEDAEATSDKEDAEKPSDKEDATTNENEQLVSDYIKEDFEIQKVSDLNIPKSLKKPQNTEDNSDAIPYKFFPNSKEIDFADLESFINGHFTANVKDVKATDEQPQYSQERSEETKNSENKELSNEEENEKYLHEQTNENKNLKYPHEQAPAEHVKFRQRLTEEVHNNKVEETQQQENTIRNEAVQPLYSGIIHLGPLQELYKSDKPLTVPFDHEYSGSTEAKVEIINEKRSRYRRDVGDEEWYTSDTYEPDKYEPVSSAGDFVTIPEPKTMDYSKFEKKVNADTSDLSPKAIVHESQYGRRKAFIKVNKKKTDSY